MAVTASARKAGGAQNPAYRPASHIHGPRRARCPASTRPRRVRCPAGILGSPLVAAGKPSSLPGVRPGRTR